MTKDESNFAQPATLQLSHWGVGFGQRVVLSDVTLTLPPQGIDVLMGPVKTGKSTLVRSLAGLNDASAIYRSWGEARLHGQAIGSDCRPAIFVQHATLLQSSVRDALIAHQRKHETQSSLGWTELASATLDSHGLAHLKDQLTEPLHSLPTHWQRAVGILSLVLGKPTLLMVDEPTYGLEDAAAAQFIKWLKPLQTLCPLLVVLHHQGQARELASRVILLGGGRVLAHEPTDVFFSSKPALNPLVEQFVRTGGLSMPSPDARFEDLAADIELPPPLPATAVMAMAAAQTVSSVTPVAVDPLPAPAPVLPVSSIAALRSVVQRQPVKLAAPSINSVEDASSVGRVFLSAHRGPVGFYWIVPGKLAGCAEPGAGSASLDYDLELLQMMGIHRLITLTEKDLDQNALEKHELRNIHLSIYDGEAPSLTQTYMLLKLMQTRLDAGEVLAVHCKAGIGRTGTILAAWLIREGGLSAESAIARLRTINKSYVQTEVQEQFLYKLEQDLLSRI